MFTNIYFLGLQKAFDVTLNFKYRGPLWRVLIYDYRGPSCQYGDYYKCTLIVPLCHLSSLCSYNLIVLSYYVNTACVMCMH